jgi:hypothetical protein
MTAHLPGARTAEIQAAESWHPTCFDRNTNPFVGAGREDRNRRGRRKAVALGRKTGNCTIANCRAAPLFVVAAVGFALTGCQVACATDADCNLGERCDPSGHCSPTPGGPAVALIGTKPLLLSTIPFPDEAQASPISPVSAFFARPIDPLSVNRSNFLVQSESGEIVAGEVGVSLFPTSISFVPTTPFQFGRKYTATLPATTRDLLSGETLGSPYVWSFRILTQ